MKKTLFISLMLAFIINSFGQNIDQDKYYERIYHSCKAWGLLKYLHSEVRNGNVHLDDAFLNVVRAAKTNSGDAFNQILLDLVTFPGEMEIPGTEQTIVPDSLKLVTDTTWVYNDFYPDTVSTILENVINNFRPGFANNSYVSGYYGSIGSFRIDSMYSWNQGDYPDEEFRILGLSRFWNFIQYFYPYKDQFDKNWDLCLKEVIPMVAEARNALEYNLAIKQIVNRISDSHASNIGSSVYWDYAGIYHPPFMVRYLENELVITEVVAHVPELKIGDVILEMDGMDVHALRDSFKLIAGASNQATLDREINDYIIYGDPGPVTVKVTDGKEEREHIVYRSRTVLDTLYPASNTPYYDTIIGNNHRVRIVDIRYIETRQLIYEMFDEAQDYDAFVFDMRGYPAMMAMDIIHYLFEDTVHYGYFRIPSTYHPGTFSWKKATVIPDRIPYDPLFKARIFVLHNENTQSFAEQMCMVLGEYPNTIKIGSTTAGADGNMLWISLPGNIVTPYTGLGVYYKDFSSAQRTGIIPDYEVYNTIAGLRAGKDDVLDFALKMLIENTGEIVVDKTGPVFYPNPASDYINISFRNDQGLKNGTLKIIDISGKTVCCKNKVLFPYTLSVSTIPKGSYLLQLTVDNVIYTSPVLIR